MCLIVAGHLIKKVNRKEETVYFISPSFPPSEIEGHVVAHMDGTLSKRKEVKLNVVIIEKDGPINRSDIKTTFSNEQQCECLKKQLELPTISNSAEDDDSHADKNRKKKRRVQREKFIEVTLEADLGNKNKFQKLTFDKWKKTKK